MMDEACDNDLRDLTMITTINGENIIDILSTMGDSEMADYIWCWKQRIREEIQTRIETGVVTPLNVLTWCIRGIGWETLREVKAFEETTSGI